MYKAIRYIGSKQKILDFLNEELFSTIPYKGSFFEGFSGTGIISQYLTENRGDITVSGGDLSNYAEVLYSILNLSSLRITSDQITHFISSINEKDFKEDGLFFNEFSENGKPKTYEGSRLFFHEKAGKTIDLYRQLLKEKIKNKEISEEQSKVFLFYLLSYACKMANTTSVFGAYLKTPPKYKPLDTTFIEQINKQLEKIYESSSYKKFMNGDIVSNLEKMKSVDVIYLDPPYSTRRYESNYHILNYIVDLELTEDEIKNSKTGLPKFIQDNPFGKKKETEIIFSNMILEGTLKSKLLAISYNTDGLIKQEWMENFCNANNLVLETKKLEYKRFKSNETENKNKLEEILWLIRKKND